MKEIAKVSEVHDKNATVVIDKKDACSKCGMCLFPKNAGSIKVFANNSVNAEVGDEVLVERTERGKFLATVLVFLVPILLILLSMVLAYSVIKSEIWTLFLSVIFLVLWYTVLALIDKRIKITKKYETQIISIISKKDKENVNE